VSVIGEVFVALRAQDGGVASDADRIVTANLGEVAKKGAQILGGAVLGKEFAHQFHEGMEELKDSQAVAAQTASAIESTGGAAGVSAGHVADLAEEGLKLAGVDDELIAKGENVLLSFTQIANQGDGASAIFDRATKAGLDLATRGFGSVESNAKLLGIALSDPEQGLTRLRRAGIILTEQQKDSIAQFASQNDLLDEQKVLLDAVEQKVGGAAEAYGKTLGGQVAIAQESIKNARAEITASAAPAIELFARGATIAADAVESLPGPLRDLVAGLGIAAVGFGAIAKPISAAIDLYQMFKPAQDAVAAGNEAVTVSSAAKTAAVESETGADVLAMLASQGASAADLEQAAGNEAVAVSATEAAVAEGGMAAAAAAAMPVLLAVGAAVAIGVGVFSALSDALSDNVKAQGDYKKALDATTGATDDNVNAVTAQQLVHSNLFDTMKQGGIATGDIFAAVTKGTEDWGEYGRIVDNVRTRTTDHTQQVKMLTDQLHGAGAGNDAFSKSLLDGLSSGKLTVEQVGKIIDEMEGLHNGYKSATDEQGKNKEATDAVTEAHKQAGDQFVLEQDAIDQLTAAHAGYRDFIDQLAGAMDKTYEGTLKGKRASVDYQGAIDSLTDAVQKNGSTLDDNTEKGRNNLTQIFSTGDSIAKLIEQRFQETHSIETATETGKLYVENLKEQLRQSGLTEEQVSQYIDEMNLTPEKIDTIFSNNAMEQQIVMQKYIAELDKVPPELRTQIESELEQGHFDEVNKALDNLAAGRTVVFTPQFEEEYVRVDAEGHVQKLRAAGDTVYANQGYVVNEGNRAERFFPAVDGRVMSADQINQNMIEAHRQTSDSWYRSRLMDNLVAAGRAPSPAPMASEQFVGVLSRLEQRLDDMVPVSVTMAGDGIEARRARAIASEVIEQRWRFGR
jgi:hypothetical protein